MQINRWKKPSVSQIGEYRIYLIRFPFHWFCVIQWLLLCIATFKLKNKITQFIVFESHNPIPQPVPLLTNHANKLELPHVQRIPLLEQFKTGPLLAPSPITWEIYLGLNSQTSQNLKDLDQVSPQESCLKSKEPQDPQTSVLNTWSWRNIVF